MELEKVFQYVGGSIGVIGFAFGLYEYYIAQKWKRSELAAKQLELLESCPEIKFCCQALDYSARRIPTPEKYKVFTQDESFVHTQETMISGLPPESGMDHFEWPLVVYRDAFDRFFSYLEGINHYISIGLFSKKDVSSLEYWLKQLANPRFLKGDDKQVFIKFIRAYKYDGVLKLMDRFKVDYTQNRA